jgi:hypothetical protein
VGPVVTVVPAWFPVPGELMSVGLTSVLLAEGKLDVGDVDVGGAVGLVRPDAEADAVALALGPAVLAGLGLEVWQGLAVALAFLLPVALTFDVAEADVVAVLVARLLAVAVEVAVAVLVAEAVPVAEELVLPLGLTLALPLPGLSLALPLPGVVPEPAGLTSGVCDLLALAGRDALDDAAGDEQAVGFALL